MKAGTSPNHRPSSLGLFTDFYELTMLRAYFEEGMHEEATFSLFVRRLPERRNFLMACGLDTLLDCLEVLRFTAEDLAYLKTLGRFSDDFLGWLGDFRFTGDIYAVPEGTPVFPNEPILEVVAPLPQAQLIETLVMNQIHLQTVLASKAARVVRAAEGRQVVDFGARRMHGIDAALKAARAFYIAGVAATSNTLAACLYGIPVAGTMAHSYIQAHDDELEAFRDFAALYPDTVLLVDTYDTLAGVRKVVRLARALGTDFKVQAIRLDSGDLDGLARESRRILDEAGLEGVRIFASGGLDEDEITGFVKAGAPIDAFGIGTHMGVSDDAPDLDIAYKLSAYAGKGRLKLSAGKPVLPGRKQIFRREENGVACGDIISRADEAMDGRPLLEQVMKGGKRMGGPVTLEAIRAHAQAGYARLPAAVRALTSCANPYPVTVSDALACYQEAITREIKGTSD